MRLSSEPVNQAASYCLFPALTLYRTVAVESTKNVTFTKFTFFEADSSLNLILFRDAVSVYSVWSEKPFAVALSTDLLDRMDCGSWYQFSLVVFGT